MRCGFERIRVISSAKRSEARTVSTHQLELPDVIWDGLLALSRQVVHDLVPYATEQLLLPRRVGRYRERRQHLPDRLVFVVQARSDRGSDGRIRLDEIVEQVLHAEREGGDGSSRGEEGHEVAAESIVEAREGPSPTVDRLLTRCTLGGRIRRVQVAEQLGTT